MTRSPSSDAGGRSSSGLRLAAYLRVSTDRQAEEGFGIDVQEQVIKSWAKGHGHRVVAWFRDEGVSGSNGIESREALPLALAALEPAGGKRQADGLVIARLDRLARVLDVQEAILAHVWKLGAHVFTVDGGEVLRDDPEDPMRRAMRQMMGVFAELERGMITARMRAGRRRKAEHGGYAYGAPPIGLRPSKRRNEETGRVERVLTPDEKEQALIGRMLEMSADGLSTRQIAERLNAEGIGTKRRSRKGKDVQARWHSATVARVLKRSG